MWLLITVNTWKYWNNMTWKNNTSFTRFKHYEWISFIHNYLLQSINGVLRFISNSLACLGYMKYTYPPFPFFLVPCTFSLLLALFLLKGSQWEVCKFLCFFPPQIFLYPASDSVAILQEGVMPSRELPVWVKHSRATETEMIHSEC